MRGKNERRQNVSVVGERLLYRFYVDSSFKDDLSKDKYRSLSLSGR